MASSRWKRFAFFQRHTLNLPYDVLDDLVSSESIAGSSDGSGSKRSLPSLAAAAVPAGAAATAQGDLAVSLVVTTAALPIATKPITKDEDTMVVNRGGNSSPETSLEAMWCSLVACTAPQAAAGAGATSPLSSSSRVPLVPLPSQAGGGLSTTLTSSSAASSSVDGLVLAYVSSRETELVHCVDLTIRCNPGKGNSAQELDDLDGWRGYFSPFKTPTTDATEQRVIGLAACRTSLGKVHVACIGESQLVVWEDPHLHLSCRRPLTSPKPPADAVTFAMTHSLSDGKCCVVDIQPAMVAVGMDSGAVLVFVYNSEPPKTNHLRAFVRIPPPPTDGVEVVSVKLALGVDRASVFCSYRLKSTATTASTAANSSTSSPTAGVCCYEMPLPTKNANTALSAPSARHDLDGRYVSSQTLVDASSFLTESGGSITVARPDGLYSYSKTERTGVAPIDGTKLAFCLVPPPVPGETSRHSVHPHGASTSAPGYLALVASTDVKSGRDAVDIYDSMNKLVAFHLLLSPGHRAVRAAALATSPTASSDGSVRGGRSSAIVLTSGGSLITLTEKLTEEKISLLVQKNLYAAAIVVAYADPATDVAVITSLYRQYAEHLYRKGDFSGAIDQYCHTIGSLESSHVIFRYLDAPKIPMLVKYLERLRTRGLATPVHNELLRTCYLKLNDTEAADAIAASASSSVNKASMAAILSNLSSNPKEALATMCSLEAPQAAEILVIHGATLARALPRETAGVVVALCLGTYSPKALAEAALIDPAAVKRMIERGTDDRPRVHEPYPFHLFSTSFLENPKLLRLVLTHCNRNKCYLTASLRRTLLELTLAEWNQAKIAGDVEAEKLRHKEALVALTDSHSREIGDYDALVIVQQAGFEEGELLLYERLQMTHMLLERYAKDGTEKSRRQMLAMSQSDSEVLAEVLGHFVKIASEKLNENQDRGYEEDASEDDESDAILDDIREALSLARRQGILPPVRVARILAGEGTGQFSAENAQDKQNVHRRTIPLSVALDYVGTILEESRKEISRLRSEVEEYNQLCNTMESEIDSLLRASLSLPPSPKNRDGQNPKLSIDDMYAKVRSEESGTAEGAQDQPLESFWRDMNQSEDTFEVIARYFAKGVIR